MQAHNLNGFEPEAARTNLRPTQYKEQVHTRFTADQRAHTTVLHAGLTYAHDVFVVAGMRGLGYRSEMLECPDNAALQIGKEFGNRGQCNPTYFTVGNVVKHLIHLRDEKGLSTKEIIDDYLFVTAGACGPCRFGTYVTEYRKALRDAGFDGFRVLLFQQQGGLKQATGDASGLAINREFMFTLARAVMAGDVLNLMGYRLRPYEVEPGAVDAALAKCRAILCEAMENRRSIVMALRRCRPVLDAVKLDRLQAKPVVSIIGEFWAMTTEGDGNYHLQKFLESEGAEVDVQGVTNWLLYVIWENRYDRLRRIGLRRDDGGMKGLDGKDAAKTLRALRVADTAVRVCFGLYARATGLRGYHLPDLDRIASLAANHYDNNVRGGEGHMEVGKLVHFVLDRVNHMTVSVKPFGCMPSSGVSDGVQSLITTKYPQAIFLPIETTGDGQVNVQSRIQMMLFKARQRAREEYQDALQTANLTERDVRRRLALPHFATNFWRPRHAMAGAAANIVHAVARPSGLDRWRLWSPARWWRALTRPAAALRPEFGEE